MANVSSSSGPLGAVCSFVWAKGDGFNTHMLAASERQSGWGHGDVAPHMASALLYCRCNGHNRANDKIPTCTLLTNTRASTGALIHALILCVSCV